MMTNEKERAAAYALSRIYQFEPRIPRTIVETLGSAGAIFGMDRDALDEALGPYNRHRSAIAERPLEDWAEELDRSCRRGWRYLSFDEPEFPQSLWTCEDSPLGLFIKSADPAGDVLSREMVSVIGTRDLSSYGSVWCRKIVGALASTRQKPTIVSGLAFGVDITAHLAALENFLPTIAVMATGAGSIYPREHENYAAGIANSKGGALITEYPPGATILATSFLCRNRIIAGLSKATVLVESRSKGGGMSTARIAASYSRDVFAIPGRNDDPRSQGCNMLIRGRVAEALTDCDSFIKSLGYNSLAHISHKRDAVQTGTFNAVRSERMSRLLLAIKDNRDIDAERLCALTGLEVKDVLSDLGILENDGMVTSDLCGRYSISDS